MKAKKALKTLHKRLGATNEYKAGATDIESTYLDTDERLDTLEKNNPGDVLMNRVSAIEANTHINLNKHNLQVEAMLTAESFKHQNMVFDDLSDATGIDAAKSIDILHDKVVGKVGIAVGKDAAEVVTVAEELTESPTMVALSFTGNSNLKNTVPLDLTQGVHTNTEIVNGKIQLKRIGTTGTAYTDNVMPAMTSNTSPSGVVDASTGTSQLPWKAFDGTTTNAWVSNVGTKTGWISYKFPSPKTIVKYTLLSQVTTRMPRKWNFEGSNSGSSWTILDSQLFSAWVQDVSEEFTFANSSAFTTYRINVSEHNGDASYLAIAEMQMMESAVQNLYSPSGSYESPVLDLGENFKSLYKLENTSVTPVGTSLTVSVASSHDGVSFTAYTPINTDGTIATAPGRYVKVKIELKASGAAKETVAHDFLEIERSNFQENEYILFDGSAKLKTAYSNAMIMDSRYVDSGTLLKSTINKNSFKSIEKVEVGE